ncbi:MAG: DUF4915 domain-containing protein [Solirubrobacteraceae bacterium]|nr:DUF4915 domain-containing protein [Solirubrobacteraceae bacterium]
MERTLVASGFGTDGGGLFKLGPGGFERIDRLETVGLAVSRDGRALVRALVGYADPNSQTHVLLYDRSGVRWYRRLDGLTDPHGLVWTSDAEIALVSTGTNAVHWLDADGVAIREHRFADAIDAWHLNCPALDASGRLVVTAFGAFDEIQGWRAPLKAREATGFVLDVESGERHVTGLTGPHDPLPYDGGWLVCNSARFELLWTDAQGVVGRRVELGGWTRGLLLDDGVVYVGVSTRRHEGEGGRAAVVEVDLDTFEERSRWELPSDEVFSLVWIDEALLAGVEAGFGNLPGNTRADPPPIANTLRSDVPLIGSSTAASVTSVNVLDRLPAGSWSPVEVSVVNGGTATLSSSGELPVYVGSRWHGASGEDRVQSRAALGHPLLPGDGARVILELATPETAGHYELTVGLVQEGVRWFHEGDPSRAVRVLIEVV